MRARIACGSLALAAYALLIPTRSAVAQNCRKGIPCGNTCISASKVCRVGAGSATAAPASAATPARTAAALPVSEAAVERPWVALRTGKVFYLAACQAAKELPREELVSFRTQEEALQSGRFPSRVPGC